MKCQWDGGWVGCPNDAMDGGRFCQSHTGKRCVSCGNEAVRSCGETGFLVCGADLCESCIHTSGGRHGNSVGGDDSDAKLDALSVLLVGKTLSDACVLCRRAEMSIRAVKVDGKALIVTCDYVPSRVNVVMRGDVIESVESIG